MHSHLIVLGFHVVIQCLALLVAFTQNKKRNAKEAKEDWRRKRTMPTSGFAQRAGVAANEIRSTFLLEESISLL